jgi:hypothetical protein
MLNFETISGWIIEAHLRFSDQWPDLYGSDWIDSVVTLYQRGIWEFPDEDRREGYSVVLFGPKGRRYRHPSAAAIRDVLELPSVSSVQITFHKDRDPERHSMPPGGFRLAIVNCWNLQQGMLAREQLRAKFVPPWAS